jgi:hypothetical protein
MHADSSERFREELESALTESHRLIGEMEMLMREARSLVGRSTRNIEQSARRRSARRLIHRR